jgi:acyl-CoA reductase-like NAD-dependent aldehyde dehydrogenase
MESRLTTLQEVPIAGGWSAGARTVEVVNPFDGATVGSIAAADAADAQRALSAACVAARPLRNMAAWERAERLLAIAAILRERAEEFAQLITLEAGKPIAEARGEALRASYVFQWAGEEAKRERAEWLPLDTERGLGRRAGVVRRVPVGPVLAITPFNFPLSLVAHKLAPALAAGNPVLLKPSLRTPLSAVRLAEVVLDQDWPAGTLSVLTVDGPMASELARDNSIAAISFTGSDAVGWRLKAENPRKHVTLELGGNAPALVEDDADLEHAVERLIPGSFAYAGQVCISTQRILVAQAVYEEFLERFVDRTSALVIGDPSDESVQVGPLISVAEADRVAGWIEGAVAAGASIRTGGEADGAMLEPVVLTELPRETSCWRQEIFGPAVSVTPYGSLSEGLRLANDTSYGLQAALFTHRLPSILRAHEQIQAGGLIVNDSPFYRAVQMPYGGVGDSGFGREGVRSAIDGFTEERLLVLPLPDPAEEELR